MDDCILNLVDYSSNKKYNEALKKSKSTKTNETSKPTVELKTVGHSATPTIRKVKATKKLARQKSDSEPNIDSPKSNLFSKPGHDEKPKKKGVKKLDKKSKSTNSSKSKSNPLQYGIDNKMSASSQSILPDLLSHPVKPNIEPVFSSQQCKSFCQELEIHPHLIDCLLKRFHLTHLTAIQETTFPVLLQSKDALVRAQTGSGKTLAYAVPLLHQLMTQTPNITRNCGPKALIILPSRELATQTFEVFKTLTQACVRIVPGLLIGGMGRKAQKQGLRKGINIAIGTPKRILDHLKNTASLNLANLNWFIIDEADRLLEMGFERDVRQILDQITQQLSGKLQTVLLSATLTPGVEQLAGMTLHDPVRCVVKESNSREQLQNNHDSANESDLARAEFSLPSGLRHFAIIVPWKLRLVTLAAFLLLKCRYHKNGGKLIVFMSTQDSVDFHYNLFKTVLTSDVDEEVIGHMKVSNVSFHRLHGNMEHKERESAFHHFSKSTAGVLLTTDVASRGLDLASIGWVLQYHITGGPVDYVHRVGRTARAGGRGKALLFLDEQEMGFLDLMKVRVGIEFERLELTDVLETALFHVRNTKMRGKQRYAACATVEEATSRFSRHFLDAVEEDPILSPLAESAYLSFLRAYASFSGELRTFFTFKQLHLGHVAQSFCLSKKPTDIAARVTGRVGKFKKAEDKGGTKRRHVAALSFDESKNQILPTKRFKPTIDVAKRNMLAEYGL